MDVHDHLGKTRGRPVKALISQEELQQRITDLGKQITRDYAGQELVLLGVLKGSFLFMADLARAIDLPVTTEFLGLSSYSGGTESSGEVKVTLDLAHPIADKHLLVVEDIVDTGLTLAYILRMLSTRNPRSLKLCCLLDKPEGRKVQIEADYVGFTIPKRFVVGYGLDYNEFYRNLPYIGVMDE